MKNSHSEYVGIPNLVKEHFATLEQFRSWAAEGNWINFHKSHYDWWMFPYDQPSQMGFAYVFYDEEITELLALPDFKQHHAEGAHLLLKSWGWDANTNQPISSPGPDQAWADWPIRLFKCTMSMKLFGQTDMYESCLEFGRLLVNEGHSFAWSDGRDLAAEMGIR
jgi:hypothetical protein